MFKNFLLLSLGVGSVFFVNALSVSADKNNCADTFTTNCEECHELERACKLLGQSEKEWIELFDYMEEMGADIPGNERKILLDCFIKPDDGVKRECDR